MKHKEKKSIGHYMRSLHRDIGFFIIGLIVIYGISGIALIYRDTNFFKYETLVETKLSPNMEASELEKALRLKDFKVLKEESEIVYFSNGTYNKTTGVAAYSAKVLPSWLNTFNKLHKSSSKNEAHWVATIFGILLLFLAISSFWMFKPGTRFFRRGIYIAGAGIVAAIILLLI
jgi:hypothetical protein